MDKIVKHLQIHKINQLDENPRYIKVQVEGVMLRTEADSGANVNVMSLKQYSDFRKKTASSLDLIRSKIKLKTLTHDLNVIGEFPATIQNQTRSLDTTFIVIKEETALPPLLGRETLTKLGMLQIDPEGKLGSEMVNKENNVKVIAKDYHYTQLKVKYKEVFEGIGMIRDKRDGREMYATFTIKEGANPVAQKPRALPFYLRKPLKEWLDKCVDSGIYEKVPDGEPITWCSPLVLTPPKPRFAQTDKDELEPHMIRASIVLRVPNKYMEQHRITQNAVVEDFTHKFHGCKIYSKLDMTMGYHQLTLHPASRTIATFSTPWGNMRPKRLIFGAKSSQDAFNEVIYRIFGDIEGCLNQRDDILIGAKTKEEHDIILEKVLQRAADYGITFSPEKCQFGAKEIDFYGYKFSEDGLKPADDKIKAVREAGRPEDKTAVKSFLGMIGYLSKFIPNYATMTSPLRTLTRKDVDFKWGSHEQKVFDKLKQSITEDTTLSYFNPKLLIVVRTEASYKDGIAAALFQRTHKGLQPVHFVSRTLSDVEKRYSQTEKDALAVKWGKDRLSIYLLGAPRFQIVTSHKPLIPMFSKPTAKLPPRVEKCVMALQDVDYEIIYEPGKDEKDPLDYLSRHPLPDTGSDHIEKTVAAIVQTNHAIVLEDIARATKCDLQLQKIIRCMRLHIWEHYKRDQDIVPFYPVKAELYEANGILMRMDKIILPDKLKLKSVKAAHKLGHLGITKTKQLLRQKYWFPELSSLVEETIGRCYECQVVTDSRVKEPTKIVQMPSEVWGEVSADFGGPYPDCHYNLVLIDKCSRYPAVEVVHSTSFKATRRAMKKNILRPRNAEKNMCRQRTTI